VLEVWSHRWALLLKESPDWKDLSDGYPPTPVRARVAAERQITPIVEPQQYTSIIPRNHGREVMCPVTGCPFTVQESKCKVQEYGIAQTLSPAPQGGLHCHSGRRVVTTVCVASSCRMQTLRRTTKRAGVKHLQSDERSYSG